MSSNDDAPPGRSPVEPPAAAAAPATPRRRGLLFGAVALGAAALGAGVAWRRHGAGSASGTAAAPQGPAAETAWLWETSFQQPDGATLQLASLRGKPLIINFWATWCPPCIQEMPDFDRFHREHAARGWQVLGLAVDGPTPVRQFLQKLPVGYPIALAGFEGTEIGRRLGNTQGGLPFTVALDASGAVLHRKLGATHYAELAAWAAAGPASGAAAAKR